MESTGLGITQLTGRLQQLEEAVSLNHHVQGVVGLRKVALRENDLVGDGPRAQSQLQSGGDDGVLGGGRAGLDQVLIQKILKLRAPGFESRGVGVRDVVRDVFHVGLLRVHAAGGAKQCSYHLSRPPLLSPLVILLRRLTPSRPLRWPFYPCRWKSRSPSASFRIGASSPQFVPPRARRSHWTLRSFLDRPRHRWRR